MRIEPLKSSDEENWNLYVGKSPQAPLFHELAWRDLVSSVLGLRPHYVTAQKHGHITGILPMFFVESRISGRRLLSLPYSGKGGICADDQDSARGLLDYAVSLAHEEHLDYLELRGGFLDDPRLALREQYYTFKLDLSPGPDVLLRNFRKSMRKSVKKALAHGMSMETVPCGHDLPGFYRFHAADMRRFGTPVQSFSWLKGLCRAFPDNHSIARVHWQDKIIAMFLVRRYKGTVSEIIGNDLPQFRHLNPNIFLQWKLIEEACRQGYRYYDFGRSIRDSGTYFFKEGWNAAAEKMPYGFYLPGGGTSIPDTSQSNIRRRLFAGIWKYLPLPLVNRTGPVIRRLYP